MTSLLRYFNELRQFSILGIEDISYTATGGVARTQEAKDFDYPSILDYGGIGDNVTDNTTALNNAIGFTTTSSPFAVTGQYPYAVHFPAGSFLFASKPATINLGASLIGVNKSVTSFVRNYSEATPANGLINLGAGGGQVPAGMVIENLALIAGNATTGGSGISIIGSDSPNGPDYYTLQNLYLSYTGSGAYSASGATLYIDGSGSITPQGSRDIQLFGIEVFSNGWPSCFFKTVVDLDWYGGNIAGLATDALIITGTNAQPSTGININISNMDAVQIDHCNQCHIKAISIQGAVTIDATVINCSVESDQPIGGTITNNSTSSWVRSGTTIIGPLGIGVIDYKSTVGIIGFRAVVNFNSGNTDTPIVLALPFGYTRYWVNVVTISGASHDISTATAGLFTAAGGGGTAIVTAASAITVTATAEDTLNNSQQMTVNNAATQSHNQTTLYWRVATAEGAAATATVTIFIRPLS